jgi:hypothetical protein
MRLIQDYRHDYIASNGFAAFCRVRVLEGEVSGGPVVIISEPATSSYDGPSVTNNIEQIAAEVLVRFALPTSETTIIEHYPPEAEPAAQLLCGEHETFDLVTFSRDDPQPRLVAPGCWILQLGEPDWKPLDRETIEALIGRALQED